MNTFQIVDWYIPKYSDQIELQESDKKSYAYDIHIYGVQADGKTVFCCIKDFQPFFYVRAPICFNKIAKAYNYITTHLFNHLQDNAYSYYKKKYNVDDKICSHNVNARLCMKCGYEIDNALYNNELDSISIECLKLTDFWGYSKEPRCFLKITAPNAALFRKLQTIFNSFNRDITVKDVWKEKPAKDVWKLYETNIEPFLRFIHEKEIKPSGWVTITDGQEIEDTNCDYAYVITTDDIKPEPINTIAPLLVASFDIECTSSCGDFPMAIKTYKRLAQDLCENANIICEQDISIWKILKAVMKADYYLDKTHYIHKIHMKEQLSLNQEDNIKSKCGNIRNILKKICDDNLKTQKDIQIEEDNIRKLLADNLPKLEGDPIIQIGTTFHRYGSDEIIYKHLVNLGSCDDIEGVDVVACKTENKLLEKWKEMMIEKKPDIITGYNIMGFDFKYIHDRSIELNMKETFMVHFGKSGKIDATYKSKTLSSSALGEVNTYFYEFEGILVIDMFVYVKAPTILTLDNYKLDNVSEHILGEKKVDLKPNEIFSKYLGTSKDRMEIGVYCIQDCVLVNRLFHKMKVLENNTGMSNVCLVPLSYIFHRGQGIKIYSLVMYECSKRKQVIPSKEFIDDGMYEGAIVLTPKTGIYVDDPIVVFDYSSLYPSSMIAENLSHESHILPEDVHMFIKDDKLIEDNENLILNIIEIDGLNHYYIKYKDGNKSTIPQILEMLINQRKATKNKIDYKTVKTTLNEYIGLYYADKNCIKTVDETIMIEGDIISVSDTYNDFEKAVFDSLQLAYKVTANSLYGQTGAKTSPIYMKSIAACTTATGRSMIMKAKDFVEKNYNADVIYGDTDSIFCKFVLEHKGKAAVAEAIAKGLEVEKAIAKHLRAYKPQALNYEKVLYPFILFSKKRYIGLLYETDPTKCKEKSMGIALKRRDSSKIMKVVYGNILKKILWENDLPGSFQLLEEYLKQIVNGDVEIDMLVISKTLRSTYKDPTKIAHKVLAERIAERDPGNRPAVNDRLAYIYIENENKSALQGERIETKEFILENPDIKPDYLHYIKNQIMNPVVQLYTLCIDQIPNYNYPENYWELEADKLKQKEIYQDYDKRMARIEGLKEQIVQKLLFDPYMRILEKPVYDTNGNIVKKRVTSSQKEVVNLDFKCKKAELENVVVNVLVQGKNGKLYVTVGDIKYEYAFNKTDKKEIKVVIGLKEYLENNTDRYLIFKIKGCASLIKEYAKIKEINIPGSEKSWLDVGAPTLIMFQPIIGYYYRMNITSV
jgi:DNA polymerase elongation subunit (family B)